MCLVLSCLALSNPEMPFAVDGPMPSSCTAMKEEIQYINYMSLYPWVNKTADYPKDLPKFISQPEGTDISQYFGLVNNCAAVPSCREIDLLFVRELCARQNA